MSSVAGAAAVIRAHRRQFVIGPEPFRAAEDWICERVTPAAWISHCPELRVGHATDAKGVRWSLLGLAVQSLADEADPLEAIARAPTANVPGLYASWAGRWLLIGNARLHMDASGLLGCFYGGEPGGACWASSSPALLCRLLTAGAPPAPDSRKLRYEVGISWYPPPRARFGCMRRLLPSQVLDLDTGHVLPRPLMPPIEPARELEEILTALIASLATTLRRLPHSGSGPWLGLTAGYDSRVMLAIARHTGAAVRPFTRIAGRMSVADRLLPPRIAGDLGFQHVFVRGRDGNPVPVGLLEEHSAGHVSEGDAQPFLTGARVSLDGVSFGGHGFALASGFAKLRLLPDHLEEPDTGALRLARLFGEPANSSARVGLREWLEWIRRHPQENLDWRDRFFIEQRQAGWLSSKEQLYDLGSLDRFPILNAARIHSLLLSVQESQRLGSAVQIGIIRRSAPELLHYPFNPPGQYFGVLTAFSTGFRLDPFHLLHKPLRSLRRSMAKRLRGVR